MDAVALICSFFLFFAIYGAMSSHSVCKTFAKSQITRITKVCNATNETWKVIKNDSNFNNNTTSATTTQHHNTTSVTIITQKAKWHHTGQLLSGSTGPPLAIGKSLQLYKRKWAHTQWLRLLLSVPTDTNDLLPPVGFGYGSEDEDPVLTPVCCVSLDVWLIDASQLAVTIVGTGAADGNNGANSNGSMAPNRCYCAVHTPWKCLLWGK